MSMPGCNERDRAQHPCCARASTDGFTACRATAARHAAALPVLTLLLLSGFFLGFSGSVDDAHITFWSAQVLAERGEIVNYNGERVEQSSALLQTLIVALLHKVSGLSVVTLAHLSTLLAACMALPACMQMAQRTTTPPAQHGNRSSAWLTGALIASAPFFVYWAASGMEAPWLALTLLLFVCSAQHFLSQQNNLLAVTALSLAAQLSRPEMPLVMCALALSLPALQYLGRDKFWSGRSLLSLLVLQFVCATLITAGRWRYFGDTVPQPVHAKTNGDLWHNIALGLQYTQDTLCEWRLLPFTLLAVAGLLRTFWQRSSPALLLAALLCLIYSGFVIASGGDWMAAGRFWVPILPLLTVFAATVLHSVLWRSRNLFALLLAVTVAGHITYLWRGVSTDFNGIPLWKTLKWQAQDHPEQFSFFERHAREHAHDIPTISFAVKLLQPLLADPHPPLQIMAGQMGMLPFHLASAFPDRLHFTDRNGITERSLTHCAAAQQLPRTRNGIGTGYEWILANSATLARECGFVLPDLVFDIETGWNRKNITALQQAGYVFVYRQRGHIANEKPDEWLPLRHIGAGQFIAVSSALWERLSRPAPVERVF